MDPEREKAGQPFAGVKYIYPISLSEGDGARLLGGCLVITARGLTYVSFC